MSPPLQVLYKVYMSFVEVGPENVQTADYFKGVGEDEFWCLAVVCVSCSLC